MKGPEAFNLDSWLVVYEAIQDILERFKEKNAKADFPNSTTASPELFLCLAFSESSFNQNAFMDRHDTMDPNQDYQYGMLGVNKDAVIGKAGVKAETYMFTGVDGETAWDSTKTNWRTNLEVGINIWALSGMKDGWAKRFAANEKDRVLKCEKCLKSFLRNSDCGKLRKLGSGDFSQAQRFDIISYGVENCLRWSGSTGEK